MGLNVADFHSIDCLSISGTYSRSLLELIKSLLGTHFLPVDNVKTISEISIFETVIYKIVLNISDIAYGSTWKRIILKKIVIDFLGLLNRKRYRRDLVFPAFFFFFLHFNTVEWQVVSQIDFQEIEILIDFPNS